MLQSPPSPPFRTTLLLIFTAVALTLVGCDRGKDSVNTAVSDQGSSRSKTQGEVSGKPFRQPPATNKRNTNVRIVKLAPQSIRQESAYVGNLQPNERVVLRSQMDGLVENVHVSKGQTVRKSQVLVNISTKELLVRLNLARTNHKLTVTNLKRDLKLAKKNLISQSQLDQSRNRRDSAKFQEQLAVVNLKKSVVRAPIRGQVKSKHVKPGEFVRKGDALVEILDLSQLLVEINVSERGVLKLKKGQQVQVELYAQNGRTLQGKIRTIGIEADPRNRTFPVEIEMDNPKESLRPGMLARVTVNQGALKKQLIVPRHAIIERDTGRVVFVVEDGRARMRRIETGVSREEQVQVVSGLKFGEQLIIEGHTKLTDKEAVNVKGNL